MQVSLSSAFLTASLGLALLVLPGCPGVVVPSLDGSSSGDITTTGPATVCTPGEQIACACPGGAEGVQACSFDGTFFEPCMCDSPSADGSGTTNTPESTTDGGTTSTSTSTSTTGTTGTGTTDEGSSSGTTDGSESSGSESSSGGMPSVCDSYMADPADECDLWLQDCPAGDKCMPWADGGSSWNDTVCSPIDPAPGQPGDPCTVVGSGTSGVDDCDINTMCWDVDAETNMGTCVEMCDGCPDESTCSDPSTFCVIANDGYITLCLPGCDPIMQDCPAGQGCYPISDAFLCAPDASGTDGVYADPCEFINVCDPGLVCLEPAATPGCMSAVGCCTEICDITDPAGDAQCSGMAGGQTCEAWYAMGTAPPGYENVGVCTAP